MVIQKAVWCQMLSLMTASPIDECYPPFPMASAEEMIVFKLQRYFHDEQSRIDGMNDDAEWNDILGMLKVQGTNLDLILLESWVTALHLRLLSTSFVVTMVANS